MTKTALFIRTRPLESNTSSSLRAISTINLLIKSGYQVTVLTTEVPKGAHNYNKNYENQSVKIVRMSTSKIYNVGVTKKVKHPLSSLKRVFRKLYNRLTIFDPLKYCINMLPSVYSELDKSYDLLVSCSDPKSSHLLCKALINDGRITYKHYLQIWGDPLVLDITKKTLVPKWIIKSKEKELLSYADSVLYVSPFTCKAQQKLYPLFQNKMNVLYPLYNEAVKYPPITKIQTIGYFGDYHSQTRDITHLYNAVKKMGLNMTVCGDSDINLEETNKISINGRVPFEKVKELESKVDLLVHISNNHGTQIPGKIYQYAGTNKPILFIEDGEIDMKSLFGKYNRFVFCENNSDSIEKAILDIDLEWCRELTPIKEFSLEENIKKLNEIIDV